MTFFWDKTAKFILQIVFLPWSFHQNFHVLLGVLGRLFGDKCHVHLAVVASTFQEEVHSALHPAAAYHDGAKGNCSEGTGRLREETQWRRLQQPGSFSSPTSFFHLLIPSLWRSCVLATAADADHEERCRVSSLPAHGLWRPEELCYFWQGSLALTCSQNIYLFTTLYSYNIASVKMRETERETILFYFVASRHVIAFPWKLWNGVFLP